LNLIDTHEVAERLGIPERTLDQWAYLGKGPPFMKLGKHRRYDPMRLQQWIDAQHEHSAPSEDRAARTATSRTSSHHA
jgi:hypothetical protein